jgi:predicted AlkP superfamily phosphohydrolase/phosphomutase
MQNVGQRGSRKVFLLALDATPISFLQENAAAIPNISFLLRHGRYIKTGSPANLFSAGAWQTFASGLMPGEQGHYFPLQWAPSTMNFIPIKQNVLVFEPFWDDLAHSGVKTIVFDAMTVPLNDDAPGIQVINWNTQCNFAPSSNRQGILKDIQRHFGKKPIGDEIPVKKSRRTLAKMRDRLIKSAKLKTDALLWLMQGFEWQCFITAYFEGHRAGHNLWPIWDDFSSDPPEEAMLDVYRELDAQIGRVLHALDLSKTGLILFSMHGMAPGYAQDHFLPTVMERINRLYLIKRGHEVTCRRGGGLARALRQTVPASVQRHVRELVGQTVQDWLVDREWRGGKDWKATPGFPVPGGGDVGFIRLNIQGREREGFLPAKEHATADYLEFLCRNLSKLRIKGTNTPLVDEIVMSGVEFPGRLSHLLPDVLVKWHADSPANEIWSDELGTIKATLKTGRGGNHTGDSFAVLAGAMAEADGLPPLSHIRDYKQFLRHYFAQAWGSD